MNDKDSIVFPNKTSVTNSAQSVAPTRAKSFKVRASLRDYGQYVNTIKAYAQAGMPFEYIANAGEFLGDIVEKEEVDASIQQGWQSKAGEIVEDENKILAWQSRGEKVPFSHQLTQGPTTGRELITISTEVTTEPKAEKTIEVIEGIGVTNQQPKVEQTPIDYLENNPYLQPIPDKKPIV